MTNEFKIISEDALKTLCKAIKKVSTIGEILDDANSVTDKTYSSFEIDKRLNTKIDKTQLTAVLDETVTDEQIPGAKAVYDDLQAVFQSVSNGKNLIASAITDKGVDTLADATFKQMADNIGMISGGSETIPTVIKMKTLNYNSSTNIQIDISKNYIVITGQIMSNTISDNKITQFSIINGVVNRIIKPVATYSECSLTGNKLTIKNTNTAGYSLVYTILEMQ